ncbi:MAG: DUF4438 domain-containing protein [Clostridia bacterium]|nr:DUF4438 domain-containing protein [Clostridia bacterium]
MLKTNKERLPVISVQGQVQHPVARSAARITTDGQPFWLTGIGGITYNAKIGDCCMGWVADHLEPGVSTRNPDDSKNEAYATLSCIGNTATVLSGEARGAKGIITGKHGGCEHVMVYFDEETLDKLAIDDKIAVRACGQGMKLLDYPEVFLYSMSPELLDKMNIEENGDKLKVGVAKIFSAKIMGAGLGSGNSASGDYDITLNDPAMVEEYGMSDLRFGDIVAIMDADCRYGRTFRSGAVTIGVVVHADCLVSGHGPGVTTLMTCKTDIIEPVVDKKANLADMFL